MKTFRTAFLILLLPLLVMTAIADVVDQDGFILQSQRCIIPQDDLGTQYDRHHPSPAIHSRLPSGEMASPVSPASTDCLQSTTRLSAALLFFLRAPPLS